MAGIHTIPGKIVAHTSDNRINPARAIRHRNPAILDGTWGETMSLKRISIRIMTVRRTAMTCARTTRSGLFPVPVAAMEQIPIQTMTVRRTCNGTPTCLRYQD